MGSSLTGAKALVSLLRSYFATFGVPEELSSDGGPEFTASVTKAFLRTWGIHHRQSSAYFPQSNGRAEVAVKGAKRLLMANVSPNGDLNNDSFLRAMLQLRNTPDPDCDLSPAEIVFGRRLRDAFAFVNRLTTFSNRFIRRTWREAWRAKEDALRARAERTTVELYKGARPLHKLTNGDRVLIQNQAGRHPRKWDKVGTVVEVLSHDQYHVKVGGSGRITKRNRRFLRLVPAAASAPSTLINPSNSQVPYRYPYSHPLTDVNKTDHVEAFNQSCRKPPQTYESLANDDHITQPQPVPDTLLQEREFVHHQAPPSPRRSSRARRPARELDPTSGQWVVKGSSS